MHAYDEIERAKRKRPWHFQRRPTYWLPGGGMKKATKILNLGTWRTEKDLNCDGYPSDVYPKDSEHMSDESPFRVCGRYPGTLDQKYVY
jgi:hypothetical protein